MNNRTNEYFNILNRYAEEKDDVLIIEAIETTSEFGTIRYPFSLGFRNIILEELREEKKEMYKRKHTGECVLIEDRVEEFNEGGIVTCLDLLCVSTADSFEDAVEQLFEYCLDNDLLYDI